MQKIPYASAVRSLMYVQVCTRLDIAYIVGKLRKYLSYPGIDHWKATKSLVILILISLDAKIVGNPHRAISTCLLEELFLRRVLSRHS